MIENSWAFRAIRDHVDICRILDEALARGGNVVLVDLPECEVLFVLIASDEADWLHQFMSGAAAQNQFYVSEDGVRVRPDGQASAEGPQWGLIEEQSVQSAIRHLQECRKPITVRATVL